ncbi:MAG TPA: hypothetical protein ENK52_06150 [Saprospiraceae bacterium]|nr:hypothetical protein [Saprospiraceae bacterium]
MRILLTFIFALGLFSSTTQAQNAYSDTREMSYFADDFLRKAPEMLSSPNWQGDSLTRFKFENFLHFLQNPFGTNIAPFEVSEIINLWDGEQYFFESDTTSFIDIAEIKMSDNPKMKRTANIAAPTGLSLTTRLVDATARFLVDRTKKELTISFFDKFRDQLDEVHNVPFAGNAMVDIRLKTILPNTYLLLDSRQYFDTPSMGETWITAFKKDIGSLPFSIENTLKVSKNFRNSKTGHFTLALFDMVDRIEQGYHPLEVIEDLGNTHRQYNTHQIDQYFGLLALLALNSTGIDFEGVRHWLSVDELNAMPEPARKYFLGLIYQQGLHAGLLSNIRLTDTSTLAGAVTLDNYPHFFSVVKGLMGDLNKIDDQLTIVKDSLKSNSAALGVYLTYTNAVYTAFDHLVENTFQLAGTDAYYESDYFRKFRPIAYDIVNFNRSVSNENYGESLLVTISFLKHLSDGNKEMDGLIKPLTYYANFLIDIIVASENEAIDLKGIIENYALPVGSYRIKRHQATSIDLNAYPGLYTGYEFSQNSSNSANFGVTAPIGFSFSWRSSLEGATSASHSIFLSAIDIGAPFSYRFVNDETAGFPANIKWEQIFSPGLFYIYGFNNSPLVFSAGLQYTPSLRKVEVNQITTQQSVLRFGLSLSVDIPVFNLRRR